MRHGRRWRQWLGDVDVDGRDRGHVVELLDELEILHEVSPALSGGDLDADWARAESSGEEAVGGSEPTPDQDVVDELGRAAGVTYAADEPLRPEEKEAERDDDRWELDPASAEDYDERMREQARPSRPRLPH